MTQDFAKIRPEPILERKQLNQPPAWSFMLTGIIVGISIGVFACVLLYMSGMVPPLSAPGVALAATPVAAPAPAELTAEGRADEDLELEYYEALPAYVVQVEATPVELTPEQSGESVAVNYLLQSGAFQQRYLAELEIERQRGLGLGAYMKVRQAQGRTQFLVQSGPYTESRDLNTAEQILRRNNIPNLRLKLQ